MLLFRKAETHCTAPVTTPFRSAAPRTTASFEQAGDKVGAAERAKITQYRPSPSGLNAAIGSYRQIIATCRRELPEVLHALGQPGGQVQRRSIRTDHP